MSYAAVCHADQEDQCKYCFHGERCTVLTSLAVLIFRTELRVVSGISTTVGSAISCVQTNGNKVTDIRFLDGRHLVVLLSSPGKIHIASEDESPLIWLQQRISSPSSSCLSRRHSWYIAHMKPDHTPQRFPWRNLAAPQISLLSRSLSQRIETLCLCRWKFTGTPTHGTTCLRGCVY